MHSPKFRRKTTKKKKNNSGVMMKFSGLEGLGLEGQQDSSRGTEKDVAEKRYFVCLINGHTFPSPLPQPLPMTKSKKSEASDRDESETLKVTTISKLSPRSTGMAQFG